MTATQFAKASYQEIIDLKTTTDTVSAIGIHTPTSRQPYTFMNGFFSQFKKYKYNGCSIALVPAARLPADIAQVGYGAGEPPIDARDILNPVLFHGCHGESMGTILDQFLNGPSSSSSFDDPKSTPSVEVYTRGRGENTEAVDLYERLYYRALTDNTWMKAHPQSGFRKKGMRPLVYEMSTNHAIGNHPYGLGYAPEVNVVARKASGMFGPTADSEDSGSFSVDPTVKDQPLIGSLDLQDASQDSDGLIKLRDTFNGVNYFTSRMHPLGWLDTTTRVAWDGDYTEPFTGLVPKSDDYANALYHYAEQPNILPLLYMGLILLPPAYKAKQYMRLIINHSFSFRGFRGVSTNNDIHAMVNYAQGPMNNGGYNDLINES